MKIHYVDIREKFLKDQTSNKKYVAEKDNFGILRCSYVTYNDL